MFRSGLLILSLPPKHLLSKLKDVLSEACTKVQKTLYIKVDHRQNLIAAPSRIDSHNLCHLVPQIYSQASRYCSHLDVRVLQTFSKHIYDHHISDRFQVVLSDSSVNLNRYLKHQFNVEASRLTVHSKTDSSLDESENVINRNVAETKVSTNLNEQKYEQFDWVCMGGTFDRLHNGHKVLLSEAINVCSKELVIGVTDGTMLKSKTLCELIEPAKQRIDFLNKFLLEVKPNLTYRLEPIFDPFGPAITMPELQCIVVSQETRRGGDMVNEKRTERGMKALEVREVSLIEDAQRESDSEEWKVSSSSLRRRCLGTFLKEPKPNPALPDLPYLIGLTGGIASGKSSIGRRLQDLGAGLLDCDKLAHLSYAPGTPTHSKLIQEFGSGILSSDNTIDRKLLGNVVFGDEAKRQKLNSIVWPAVGALAQTKVKFLYESGHKVVVLEAALLVEAGWQEIVHQLWVSVIPEKEAVKRVMSRDGLSEEAALKRIQSQTSNKDRVSHAHVLLSTLWEPEETQKEVEKAWLALKEYLQMRNICRL